MLSYEWCSDLQVMFFVLVVDLVLWTLMYEILHK